MKYFEKKGFTLIELLIIVAIIALLATVILVSLNQAKKNARINGTKTSLKTALSAIISCNDSGGAVNLPNATETGLNPICNPPSTFSGAFWPKLSGGYLYVTTGSDYTANCSFQIDTQGDLAGYLMCTCDSQRCN